MTDGRREPCATDCPCLCHDGVDNAHPYADCRVELACTCAPVRAGRDVVGRNWAERCPAHGIGTPWFDRHERPDGTTMRQSYESFRRRVFPALPARWKAEDDLR